MQKTQGELYMPYQFLFRIAHLSYTLQVFTVDVYVLNVVEHMQMAAKSLPEKEPDNYYYPTTEEDIIALVRHAYDNGLRVRVRGAGHSMPQAIFANPSKSDKVNVKARAPDGPNIEIKLDRYCAVTRDESNPTHVTAQAGVHLGRDPIDRTSTEENSLLYQLNEWGLALGNLGGISHQSVAGFLCTGSSGGSLTHSIHENIQAIRIIDGTGELQRVELNLC